MIGRVEGYGDDDLLIKFEGVHNSNLNYEWELVSTEYHVI